ncbi:MAG: RdgB/HAM1 family non-canonical purine NTP pyrophosphatase [Bacteroidota bacterium]
MKIIFATRNENKVREVNQILGERIQLLSLQSINSTEEIPETQLTIKGNALQKAQYIHDNYGVDCFAEDSGLEVDALDGAPGVHTAYYAGPERDADANMQKTLNGLAGKTNRDAQFRTVVALILKGKAYTFEGIARGTIAMQKMGEQGFGYDPIFVPDGETRSFAQMSAQEKNAISHRSKAIQQLKAFFDDYEDLG